VILSGLQKSNPDKTFAAETTRSKLKCDRISHSRKAPSWVSQS